MGAGETGLGNETAVRRKPMRAMGTIVLVALLALGVCAAAASADPLSMTFTEDRANVGVQLEDQPMFEPPQTAPFHAEIDPLSGQITAGALQVPDFVTDITDPIDAHVTVAFDIGGITGSFDQATGALTLSGTAGGTLTSEEGTSEEEKCTVSTDPSPLTLTTAGSSGEANPRFGALFANGLTGAGALAGEWDDMHAEPVSEEDEWFCEHVYDQIGGPGGIWLEQEGDVVPPSAPQLTSTDPASPGSSGTPRIRGAAEAASTVRIYASPNCAGTPVATAGAAELGSPGITVQVAEGVTDVFSATATDAAGNTSACSVPISYTHLKPKDDVPPPPPPAACVVPKLAGKTLARAKEALRAANCKTGEVRKPKQQKGKKRGALVVKSSNPGAGAKPASGEVNLTLGPKPRKARH